MFGVQTASGVRKSLVRQIRCKAPTLLKWLQTWSLTSFKIGRILDPENTVARTFSTLSAHAGQCWSLRLCPSSLPIVADILVKLDAGYLPTWHASSPARLVRAKVV
jgi:hypothetical protein